jgi:predicted transcriptional regulator
VKALCRRLDRLPVCVENEAKWQQSFDPLKSNKYPFMKVKEIMTKRVEAVVPDTPIQEAAGRIRSLDVRVLPVSKKIALSEC